MGRPRRVHCRICNRHIDDCGPLSARGLCEDDSIGRQVDAITQMSAGRGPVYERYASGLAAYAARVAQRVETKSG